MRKGCAGHLKVATFPPFLTSNVHFVRKGCARRNQKSQFLPQVLDVQRPFRAKGLRATNKSCNFSSVFDVQRPFRAKGLRATQSKVAIFTSVFGRPTSISCERVARDASKLQLFPQFLTSNVHFVRKGCRGRFKIAILPRFWTSNVHFVRKGCVSWRSGGTAPALRENRRRARGDLQM